MQSAMPSLAQIRVCRRKSVGLVVMHSMAGACIGGSRVATVVAVRFVERLSITREA